MSSSVELNVAMADPPNALERDVSAARQRMGTKWILVSVKINKATYIRTYVAMYSYSLCRNTFFRVIYVS